MIDLKNLISSGVHFGHITSRLHPRMRPYMWGVKNNVDLIDVSKTAALLEKAAAFLQEVAAQEKQILWIGTKKPAQEIIRAQAEQLNQPFVSHRWIGGTLTNFGQVKKSSAKLGHFEDIIAKSESSPHYTKKELNVYGKIIDRLKKNIGGIKKLTWPVGAIVIVDAKKEISALREAAATGIPVVALVDSNSDPLLVTHVIPGNDDAPKAIKCIVDYLGAAVAQGQKEALENKERDKQAAAAQKSSEAGMGKKTETQERVERTGKKDFARKGPRSDAAPKKVSQPVVVPGEDAPGRPTAGLDIGAEEE